jgi:hypothetical protein
MTPGSAESPNRSRLTSAGRAYGQGLMEQPLLGMHYAANLERARTKYRQERQTSNQQGPEHTTVVVAAAELSHNAAGDAAGQPFPPVGAGAVGADPRGGAAAGVPAVLAELDMAVKRLCHGLPEPRELMGPLWTRLAVDLARRFDGIVGVAPLAASSVRSLPRESGPEMPGAHETSRHLTTCIPAQACVVGGGRSSSSDTAKASLSWSRLRAVPARRNRH